jgi:hypothetical protein
MMWWAHVKIAGVHAMHRMHWPSASCGWQAGAAVEAYSARCVVCVGASSFFLYQGWGVIPSAGHTRQQGKPYCASSHPNPCRAEWLVAVINLRVFNLKPECCMLWTAITERLCSSLSMAQQRLPPIIE